MLRITLRSLWEHKRRLVSTTLAVLLGVAFMSGTLVLADTLDKVFDDLFADVNEGIDAQVQGVELFESQFGPAPRATLDESLAETIAGLEGVDAAEPFVQSFGFGANNRLLDPAGEAVGSTQGPPTLLESWIDDDELNPFTIREGRPPQADDEVVINAAAVEEAGFELGDQVRIITQDGERTYDLVGVSLFGDAESAAGAVDVAFTLAEAQRIAGLEDEVQVVIVDGADGLSQQDVVDAITPVVPDDAESITGDEATEQRSDAVTSGVSFFRIVLTVFAVIALVVGMFIISNTFAILIAQRTRELALLRAVGASRRQVLGSVLLEASLIGLVAAGIGLLGGIGLARLVVAAFEAAGAEVPTTTLQIRPPTVIVALVVGLTVTVAASIFPAVRATRVPPLAAIRDVSIDRAGASRIRVAAGVLVALVAVVNLSQAFTADGDTDAVPVVGAGAFLFLVAAIIIGPVLAGPSVRALGTVLPRLAGVTGRLSVENAMRSPKRTSATASALVISVTLVAFITIFASSATASIESEVNRGFNADLVVQSSAAGFGPPSGFPGSLTEQVREVEGVEVVTAFGFSGAQITYPSGKEIQQFLTTAEPDSIQRAVTPRMAVGEITDLTDGGVVVDVELAEENDVELGDMITIQVIGGQTREFEVQALSDDFTLLGFFTITRDDFASLAPEVLDLQAFVVVEQGADLETVQQRIDDVISSTPTMEVLDRDGFIGDLASQLTQFVTFIYALLGLSVVIALIGIANTLSLSITERTRELGLLRAVGMTRGQMKTTVRLEAVLISMLGTLVGMGVGLVLSFALVTSLEGFGLTTFDVPVTSMVVIAVAAAVLGTLSSLRPSRRAARLDVLRAIAEE